MSVVCSERSKALRASIKECEGEWQRLRTMYDAEVQRCASLRDALQALQAAAAAEAAAATRQAPVQQVAQQVACQDVEQWQPPAAAARWSLRTAEELARMALEDDLARFGRELAALDSRARALEEVAGAEPPPPAAGAAPGQEGPAAPQADAEAQDQVAESLDLDLERALAYAVSLAGARAAEEDLLAQGGGAGGGGRCRGLSAQGARKLRALAARGAAAKHSLEASTTLQPSLQHCAGDAAGGLDSQDEAPPAHAIGARLALGSVGGLPLSRHVVRAPPLPRWTPEQVAVGPPSLEERHGMQTLPDSARKAEATAAAPHVPQRPPPLRSGGPEQQYRRQHTPLLAQGLQAEQMPRLAPEPPLLRDGGVGFPGDGGKPRTAGRARSDGWANYARRYSGGGLRGPHRAQQQRIEEQLEQSQTPPPPPPRLPMGLEDEDEDVGGSLLESTFGWIGGIASNLPDAGELADSVFQRMFSPTHEQDEDDAETWSPEQSSLSSEHPLTPRGTRVITASGGLVPVQSPERQGMFPGARRSPLAAGLQGRPPHLGAGPGAGLPDEEHAGPPTWRAHVPVGPPPPPEDPDPDEEWCCPTPPRSPSPQRQPTTPRSETQPLSACLDEEGRRLREALAEELRQLTVELEALAAGAPGGDPAEGGEETSEPSRALRELFQALARGESLAPEDLPPGAATCAAAAARGGSGGCPSGRLLGWTAWHVAAACGRSGALERLKEAMLEAGGHHKVVLGKASSMTRLTPLGVALILGQVDTAKSLLMGMAPVDSVDARGNTPLHWAVAGGEDRALVPLLLEARADASVQNRSGQRVEALPYLEGRRRRLQGLSAPAPGAPRAADSLATGTSTSSSIERGTRAPAAASPAATAAAAEATMVSLAGPVFEPEATPAGPAASDAAGFARNASARALARLSPEESELGVLSEWVVNYTRDGLPSAAEQGRPVSAAASGAGPQSAGARQALVITARRLLFFDADAEGWALAQAVPLPDLLELAVSPRSPKLLVMRMRELPDSVIGVPAATRGRLLGKLRLATRTAAEEGRGLLGGGAADAGLGAVRLRQEGGPLVVLLDEGRRRAGALASVGAGGLVLLPFAPCLLYMAGEDTLFFGVLDLRQPEAGGEGAASEQAASAPAAEGVLWRRHLVALKAGEAEGDGKRLLWCCHSHHEATPGDMCSAKVQQAQVAEAEGDEEGTRFSVDCLADDGTPLSLLLRTSAPQTQGDWLAALRR